MKVFGSIAMYFVTFFPISTKIVVDSTLVKIFSSFISASEILFAFGFITKFIVVNALDVESTVNLQKSVACAYIFAALFVPTSEL